MRNGDPDGFWRVWERLDPSRRSEITAAVERGEALADLEDAKIAVHLAARWQRQYHLLLVGPMIVAGIVLAIRLATGSPGWEAILWSMGAGATLAIFAVPAWRKWQVVLRQALELNRDVLRLAGEEE